MGNLRKSSLATTSQVGIVTHVRVIDALIDTVEDEVEDLFTLTLHQLDEIAVALDVELRNSSRESFIKPKTTGSALLDMTPILNET